MTIVPFEKPIHIHTKVSKRVKTRISEEARKLGVPENTVINSILANALKTTARK